MTDIDFDNWVRGTGTEWDESRYDPENPDECQLCGTELKKVGGVDGGKAWCPECERTVLLL